MCIFEPLVEFLKFRERFSILPSEVSSCSAPSESVTFFAKEVKKLTMGRLLSPAKMPLRLRFGLEPLSVMVAVFIDLSFLVAVAAAALYSFQLVDLRKSEYFLHFYRFFCAGSASSFSKEPGRIGCSF